MTMADTVAVMNQGRIEQMGSPATLYDLPGTAFVANFLGQANMLDATVEGSDGDWLLMKKGDKTIRALKHRAAATQGRVAYCVRPEKFLLHENEPTDLPRNHNVAGPGTLVDVSFSGVSTQYIVDVPGMATASVFEQNLDVEPVSARPGDQVWLTWDEGHAFVVAGGDHLTDGVVIEDTP